MRDDLGRVICHHGRIIACLECGEDYEREINSPAIELPDKHPLRIRAEKAEAERDTLAAEVERLRAQTTWQPIETGPEDDVAWVCIPNGRPERAFYAQDERGGWNWCDADDGTKLKPQPTLWCPFIVPPAPVERREE